MKSDNFEICPITFIGSNDGTYDIRKDKPINTMFIEPYAMNAVTSNFSHSVLNNHKYTPSEIFNIHDEFYRANQEAIRAYFYMNFMDVVTAAFYAYIETIIKKIYPDDVDHKLPFYANKTVFEYDIEKLVDDATNTVPFWHSFDNRFTDPYIMGSKLKETTVIAETPEELWNKEYAYLLISAEEVMGLVSVFFEKYIHNHIQMCLESRALKNCFCNVMGLDEKDESINYPTYSLMYETIAACYREDANIYIFAIRQALSEIYKNIAFMKINCPITFKPSIDLHKEPGKQYNLFEYIDINDNNNINKLIKKFEDNIKIVEKNKG